MMICPLRSNVSEDERILKVLNLSNDVDFFFICIIQAKHWHYQMSNLR